MMEYLGSVAKDFIFFSGDVQTTAIAVAITSSLCCSIMAAIIQLIAWAHAHPSKLQKQSSIADMSCQTESPAPAKSSVSKQKDEKKSHFQMLKQLLQREFYSCICQGLESKGPTEDSSHDIPASLEVSPQPSKVLTRRQSIPLSKVASVQHFVSSRNLQTGADVIDLSFQNMHQCPDRLGYSGSHLRSVNLSNNNLASLPEEMGCLTGLQELQLKYNSLTTLPSSLVSLKNLYELDLRGNSLNILPECVCSLTSLKYLNVSCNKMENLPTEIGSLKSLRELFAGLNNLENIPKELCLLKNLQVLDCKNNNIKYLPDCMGDLVRLKIIDLSDCKLVSLPASITRCAALTTLKLGNNRLGSLPVQIGRLHGLRELDVHNNHISVFPASLSGLPLHNLTVYGNECSDRSWEDLSVDPCAEFPPLLEITARFIAQRNLPWKMSSLPKILADYLDCSVECSTCEGPCFKFYSSKVTLSPVGRQHQWLPLLERCCSPHCSVGCKFRA